MRRFPALIVLVSAVALAGCGGAKAVPVSGASPPAALRQAIPSLERLVARRSDAFPQNHMRFGFPATVTVNDSAKVRAVASALFALPLMPAGTFHCPADFGIVYHLAFSAPGRAFPLVSVAATGCQEVHGLGATRWVARTPGFWRTLGAAMGLAHPGYAAFRGRDPG